MASQGHHSRALANLVNTIGPDNVTKYGKFTIDTKRDFSLTLQHRKVAKCLKPSLAISDGKAEAIFLN